ncbi:hypothetical protein SteCoe_10494 [Stentor coeruleus]|uniref:RING-type domain-containing protein n=1 Tax=Stentor coeruleus TaxID=5963 RepID=A0A1R2CFE9_9CILI|nr:hypothetical protein SteCoe_10494 [Stentor coeruleus]
MGSDFCKSDAVEYPPLKLSRNESVNKFLNTTSNLNTSKLSDQFSNQVKLLKDLGEAMKKGIQMSQESSKNFINSLESLDFYLCNKSLDPSPLTTEIFECPGCKICFDSIDRIPLRLPCRHSLCKLCAFHEYSQTNTIYCPQDESKSNFPPDELITKKHLLSQIEASEQQLLCLSHKLKCENFCITCKTIICPGCLNDHQNHTTDLLNSSKVNEEIAKWYKDFGTYIVKLEETKKKIEDSSSMFTECEELLLEHELNHIKSLKESREKVILNLMQASNEHIYLMESSLREIIEHMPRKKIRQFKDSITEEINRADEVKKNWDLMRHGEKLGLVKKIEIKSRRKIDLVNMEPWIRVSEALTTVKNFESMSIILATIQK